jgi:TonB family protein
MISKNKKLSMNALRKWSIVPVALAAMYLFACNREGQNGVNTISAPLSKSVWQDSWTPMKGEEPIIVVGYCQKDAVSQKKDVIVTHESERKIARGAISYHEIEQKPVFQETDNNFRRYLAMNMIYPAIAQENGICGTVVLSFIVDKDGNVTDVKSPVKIDILSDVAERVIQSSPIWKPGSQNGKNVAVQCYTFMEFKLQN